MRPIKLVIFDIAGTIVEDRGEVLGAFASALRKHQIPFTESELREWKGAAKREVIRHFVERQSGQTSPQSQIVEEVYSSFRSLLEEHYRQQVVPIAGAAGRLPGSASAASRSRLLRVSIVKWSS